MSERYWIDFIDMCKDLDVTEITMDYAGIGRAVADSLKEEGIKVKKVKIK